MADDKDKIAKLEERLEKAAVAFKEMKSQLDDKMKENEALKTRVAELEDELTLNGGAVEEVEGLKARIEKAKEIFSTQKAKIAEVTELNNNHVIRITELENEKDKLNGEIKELIKSVDILNETNEGLCDKLERIKDIVKN